MLTMSFSSTLYACFVKYCLYCVAHISLDISLSLYVIILSNHCYTLYQLLSLIQMMYCLNEVFILTFMQTDNTGVWLFICQLRYSIF